LPSTFLAKRYFSVFCEADRASDLGDIDCPFEDERARRDFPPALLRPEFRRFEELDFLDFVAISRPP
jgi:hypothetical protein